MGVYQRRFRKYKVEAESTLYRLHRLFDNVSTFLIVMVCFLLVSGLSFGVNYGYKKVCSESKTVGIYAMAITAGILSNLGTYIGAYVFITRLDRDLPSSGILHFMTVILILSPGIIITTLTLNGANNQGKGKNKYGAALITFSFCYFLIVTIVYLFFFYRSATFLFGLSLVMLLGYSVPIIADYINSGGSEQQ